MEIFDIPTDHLLKGSQHFNCSIFQKDDSFHLAYRVNKGKYSCQMGINPITFDGKKVTTEEGAIKLKFPVVYKRAEHLFEDPRIFHHNGSLHCAFTNVNLSNGCQAQGLSQLDSELNVVDTKYIPYGKNINGAITPYQYQGEGRTWVVHTAFFPYMEKNWQFFSHLGDLHFVYKIDPTHVVVVMNSTLTRAKKVYKTPFPFSWPFGEPRGGTPPILVNEGYLTFFHSSFDPSDNARPQDNFGGRVYAVGAYIFNPYPPFDIIKFTPKPLLIGNLKDKMPLWNNAAVFPCGAVENEDKFLISYGYNDFKMKLASISKDELYSSMIEAKDI